MPSPENHDALFRLAFCVLLAGTVIMRVIFALRVRRAGGRLMPDRAAIRREGRGIFTLRVLVFLFLIALLVYAVLPRRFPALGLPLPDAARWAGVALGVASLGFWTWTHIALGRPWSAQLQLRDDHRLVTTGPYARIRHPMYTAIIAWMIGAAVITANWAVVAFAVAMMVFVATRVSREEQMMLERFGDGYREYMQRTGRFLPR
jgi:protein-S-isoprenylcysteine O-methyltransferase Ste14